ncbi:MAG: succinate dehydrogenase/fumarate reductase flavoprotein subunit, partial [Planktothrix sp.]
GSNSLLECVVYGKRTGAAIAEFVQNRKLPTIDEQRYLREAQEQLQGLLDQSGDCRISQLRQDFQDAMTTHCGVFRTDSVMREGLNQIQELQNRYQRIYLDDKG